MDTSSETINAETKYAKISDDKILAYRKFGTGSPIIFANRFRGDLDSWDPAFLDPLAKKYQVILFQYAGTGSSKGRQAETNLDMARDIIDLADYLKINKFALAGWSLGGFVTQVALTEFSDRVTHAVLIGTRPPGKEATPPEQVFFEHALKPVNDLKDEEVLFFNPKYKESIEAASKSHERLALRKKDRVQPMTEGQWMTMLTTKGFREDEYGTFDKMKKTKIPILSIAGEHDICFPVEDWFAMKGKLPTVQLLMLPETGHGPQHQYPELTARYIDNFFQSTGPAHV